MEFINLVHLLIKRGIGDFLVLHVTNDYVILDNFAFEKGNFVIRDKDLLFGMKPVQFRPCYENGFLGCIYHSEANDWQSLSFNGLEECKLPVDLSETRGNALRLATNQHGDRLCDFVGSAYRGFQLMLDNNFLPVILLKHVQTRSGESGLAVSDLRMVPMQLEIISQLTDSVRKSVEKHLSYTVDDLQMDSGKFREMFGDYVKHD